MLEGYKSVEKKQDSVLHTDFRSWFTAELGP